MRRTWRLLIGSFALLAVAGVASVEVNPDQPLAAIVLVLVALAGSAALAHQRSVAALEAGRRSEAEHVARILQGLSRSGSPDAIVEAIVRDLADGTGADHTVVIRHRPDEGTLEATLVSARPGVPSTTTRLPPSDLDPPLPATVRILGTADPVTARLEARARAVFGLADTLAAPLRVDDRIVGAIVIAHRTEAPWSAAARRILKGAAIEAAAALGRVESQRATEARASTDALTGLPNRRYFDEFCALLARRRRADDAVGILMVDIDHFKQVNDRYGHDVGDTVLRAVAGAIAGAVRDGDVPARFGGEEFAVLLRNPSMHVAVEVAERIRAAVAGLDLRGAGAASVRVSVGAAVQADPDQPLGQLLVEADRALYRAKRAGRDRVVAA